MPCELLLSEETCWGYIETSAAPIIQTTTGFLLSPSYFCEDVFSTCNKKSYEKLDANDFIRNILSDKPQYLQGDDYINDLYNMVRTKNNSKTLKMV